MRTTLNTATDNRCSCRIERSSHAVLSGLLTLAQVYIIQLGNPVLVAYSDWENTLAKRKKALKSVKNVTQID